MPAEAIIPIPPPTTKMSKMKPATMKMLGRMAETKSLKLANPVKEAMPRLPLSLKSVPRVTRAGKVYIVTMIECRG